MDPRYSLVSSPFQEIVEQETADAAAVVAWPNREQQQFGFVDDRAEQ